MTGTIWCLHGAVGMAEDWKGLVVPGWAVKRVDLWRFLDCCPMSMPEFGRALNEEAAATPGKKVLLGYSMGGRLALHALLEKGLGPQWEAAVIVSAHPGLEEESDRAARRAADAEWAGRAIHGEWADFLGKWNAQDVLAAGEGKSGLSLGDRSKLAPRRNSVARSFIDWSLGAQEPLGERVRREISCPLLWMAGERDEKFRDLAYRVGALETSIVPGAGHRVPWESARFPGMVGEFLERAVS
ncbi:MAG: alpha/beta fold hydrolase [Akkermansiaceae bacterium]|jgi:2-succinyl-6-hydroxy-2,4-cyclohexadiene-1-carboxylate synthase|nr:alpha/beta fold hydrolase [Akkermansiaceae bacterium]